MYTVYILYSRVLGKYYTGQTEDLPKRLTEHNRGKTSFMERGMPWEVVYTSEFSTRYEAILHERIIKKRGAGRFLSDINKTDG